MLSKHTTLTLVIGIIIGALGNYLLLSVLEVELYIKNLIWIIILAGALGGIVNYFFNQTTEEISNGEITKSIITGIVASALVPLFLNMISSDLVSSIRDKDTYKYFVFFGFCLVAAVSSRAFTQNISDRILKEVKDAKDIAKTAREEAAEAQEKAAKIEDSVEPLVDKETEAEDPDELEKTELSLVSQLKELNLSTEEQKVLMVLTKNSRYTYRSTGGIRSEIQEITPHEVEKALSELQERGLVKSLKKENGVRWFASQSGRNLLSNTN